MTGNIRAECVNFTKAKQSHRLLKIIQHKVNDVNIKMIVRETSTIRETFRHTAVQ
jgi:tryptophan 2,3-dioxygenase